MTRSEMIRRMAYYGVLAMVVLNDPSYIDRWLGRADFLTEELYAAETSEICARLVAGGFIVIDEDPKDSGRFDQLLNDAAKRYRESMP